VSIASEATRLAWARLTPEQRAAKVAGMNANRGCRKGSRDKHLTTIERLTEAANRAIDVLQSTDDPRMRCTLAVELLLASLGKVRKRKHPEASGVLVRADLKSGARVYLDVRELWRAALTGEIIATRVQSGEPISGKPGTGLPAYVLVGDVVELANLI
jgi:hypothetical protein